MRGWVQYLLEIVVDGDGEGGCREAKQQVRAHHESAFVDWRIVSIELRKDPFDWKF